MEVRDPLSRPRPADPGARAARAFLIAHAILIVISILAFQFVIGRPIPGWIDPDLWMAAYRHGMDWTGPLYIVTGVAAALIGWTRVLGRRGLVAAGVVTALGLGAELLGTTTGFPFGPYGYGDQLGPKVAGHVPLVIPPSWFLMLYPSLAIALRFGRGLLATSTIAALGLVAWDVLMDPAMSAAFPFWSWHEGGEYFGMPLLNWGGWLLTGFVLALAALLILRRDAERLVAGPLPLSIYALNAVFPFALALQAGLFTAAWVGGAVMLAFLFSPMLATRARRAPDVVRQPGVAS